MKKKKVVAFDLETIARRSMMDILPEIKPSGRLKDPIKIAADIEAKKVKQIADMGLDPMSNLIVCACWCDDLGPGGIMIEDDTPEAEKELIIKLWEKFADYDVFVGFNSRAFDLRTILLHGMEYGIRPSVNIDKGKYSRIGSNHIDLRPVLAGDGQFVKGKLDDFCKRFLGDHKTEGIDGSQVQSFYEMGLMDEIFDYCLQDANLTYRLYVMAELAGLLE